MVMHALQKLFIQPSAKKNNPNQGMLVKHRWVKYDSFSWYQDKIIQAPDAGTAEDNLDCGDRVATDETGDIIAVGDVDVESGPSSEERSGKACVFGFC